MITCKHKYDGLCKSCADAKPYYQFKLCKKECLNCKECGYFYGSGAPERLQGKPVIFSPQEENKNDKED